MNGSNNRRMSDSEIVSAISKKQMLVGFINLLIFVCTLGFPVILALGFMRSHIDQGEMTFCFIVWLVCLVLIRPVKKWQNKVKESLKDLTGEYIVRDILAERVGVTQYSPNSYISKKFVDNSPILPYYDRISGSDYVEGSYRGVSFQFCDLTLGREETRRSSNGKSHKVIETIYQGQVIHIDPRRELGGYVTIVERRDTRRIKPLFSYAVGALVNGMNSVMNSVMHPDDSEDIETENAEFNSRFKVSTSDGQLAFYILTPQFMESLMRLDDLAGGYTAVYISNSGVTVTLNNNRDSFEINKFIGSRRKLEKYRQKFRGELAVILGMFDEVLTKDNLFR